MIEPDKLQQLQMFVAWERKTNPGREHIAEWALGEIERLRIGHERYETARRLHPRAWDDAYTLSLKTGKPFDQVIDDLKPFVRRGGEPT